MKSLKVAVIGNNLSYGTWLETDDLAKTVKIVPDQDFMNGKDVDIVVFTGGEDISPELYNDTPHARTYSHHGRDMEEMKAYYETVARNIPIVAICRGSQFITAMQKDGFVIQHVVNHTPMSGYHSMVVEETKEFMEITSSHHQMMYPFNVKGHKVLAYADNRSHLYEVGSNKYRKISEDMQKSRKEPEIVLYDNPKALCIQGHPEWMRRDERYPTYCRKLVKDLLL